MTLSIGIIGKPSSGKTTFLNAACLTHAKVSEIPFTTIEPNKGVAYVRSKCVCKELDVIDNPQNSICIDGTRFIPINLIDVAGLVPDAHKGKGLGNKFLNDLIKADILLHIVDITGSLDKTGKLISVGENDPYDDILFLENEINLWFKEILEREDWTKFTKGILTEKRKVVEALYDRLSGVKINKRQIILSLRNSNLESKSPSSWTELERLEFVKSLRRIAKPILILANKIDKDISIKNLEELKNKYEDPIIPCSALAEHFLRKYHEDKIINYVPGLNDFKLINEDKLKEKELDMLKKIKIKILDLYGGTGIQKALDYASFSIANQICVYPVSDVNTYSDNKNNILPDAFLIEKGTLLRDFVGEKIHSELAANFMFGIDAKTKKRLGENYELKDRDIIRIVTSKS
ncbi:MAG: redox-regulated ATPase YchF [Promethearchaeota archaeon Loki_b32]|nr:MAG: redox-regulated ATPase YchF [Candidatus Lokiarchaeota archaeon Loki_b32]